MELKGAIKVVTEQSKAFREVIEYLVEAFTDGRRRRAITEILENEEHRKFNSFIEVVEHRYKDKIRRNEPFTINDLLSNLDQISYVRHSIVMSLDEVLKANDLEQDKVNEALWYDFKTGKNKTDVFKDPELRMGLQNYRDEMAQLVEVLQEAVNVAPIEKIS